MIGCYGQNGATTACPSQCTAGQYSAAGAAYCTACPNGNYAGTASTTCSVCPAGQYPPTPASTCTLAQGPGYYADGSYQYVCAAGKYSTAGNFNFV